MAESRNVWGATARELLAVKQVVKKLPRFLWDRSFTVVTDYDPLLAKRQEKMVLSMSEFDFTLRYKPGDLMIFLDALSRLPATVAGIVKTVTKEKRRYSSRKLTLTWESIMGTHRLWAGWEMSSGIRSIMISEPGYIDVPMFAKWQKKTKMRYSWPSGLRSLSFACCLRWSVEVAL